MVKYTNEVMRMTALEATISMLRSMPESDIIKVKSYVAKSVT